MAFFRKVIYGYSHELKNAKDNYGRCLSFRHYVMNTWDVEMKEKDNKVFGRSIKTVVKNMLSA